MANKNSSASTAPGWGRIRSFLNFRKFGHNYVRLYDSAIKEFGNVATVYLPHRRTIFLEPEHVKYILKDNHKNYGRGRDFEKMKRILGDGLITSEGELWKQQRRTIAPEFELQRLGAYQEIIQRATQSMAESWAASARDGSERDLGADLMKLTFQIVGEAFFGSDVVAEAEKFEKNLGRMSGAAVARMVQLFSVPRSWPTAHNREVSRAEVELEAFIFGLIEQRKKDNHERTDLLSRLMKAKDAESGQGMSEKLIRDQLITFVSAGHETTSLALTWAWYFLMQNPEKHDRLVEELKAKTNGVPGVGDLASLPYNRMVFQESLRLHPPVPAFSREAREEDTVGGFRIPKGSAVSLLVWASHRNPKYWSDPLAFEPERFQPTSVAQLPPFAYYPFGGGPHICIGETFAMVEGQMILAGLARRFSLELLNRDLVEAFPLVTLRPKFPLRVRVKERRVSVSPTSSPSRSEAKSL
jgi:cytochrome P450